MRTFVGDRGVLGAYRIQAFGRALSTRLELDRRFRRDEAARLARLDDVIELHIREGDVDLLADESAVERWPDVLAELAAQVHDEIDPRRRIDPEHVAREIAANLTARFRRRLLVDFASPVPSSQPYDFFSVLDRSGTLVPVDPSTRRDRGTRVCRRLRPTPWRRCCRRCGTCCRAPRRPRTSGT